MSKCSFVSVSFDVSGVGQPNTYYQYPAIATYEWRHRGIRL